MAHDYGWLGLPYLTKKIQSPQPHAHRSRLKNLH
jgi:hypothetical protein